MDFSLTLACKIFQPAHCQRHAAGWTNFDRNLIVGAADAAALDLNLRLDIGQRQVEHLDRILAALLRDLLQGTVKNALGNRFLAGSHQDVNELGKVLVAELRSGRTSRLGLLYVLAYLNLVLSAKLNY